MKNGEEFEKALEEITTSFKVVSLYRLTQVTATELEALEERQRERDMIIGRGREEQAEKKREKMRRREANNERLANREKMEEKRAKRRFSPRMPARLKELVENIGN